MAKTDLNRVMLIGRITRDCGSDERSFGYLPNGNARATISIAVNRSKKEGDAWVEEANFFDITIWGRMAESLKPYLLKGQQIAVEGYLKQDRWEKDGQKMSKISIVADNVQLLGSRGDNGGAQSSGGYAPRTQGLGNPQGFNPSYGQQPQNQFQPVQNPPMQSPFDNSFGGSEMSGDYPEYIPF